MNSNSNLALINPPVVTDIGILGQPQFAANGEPKRKTVADYQQELQVLEQELKTCNELAADRGARGYRLQHATTAHVLGTGTTAELQAAQAAMDESIEALMRKNHLEASIAEIKDAIRFVEGQERRQFCETIKSEFDQTFATLKQQSTDVLATYKQLQAIAVRYQGMTNRDIFPGYLRKMHLPILHTENDWSGLNQPTGTRS